MQASQQLEHNFWRDALAYSGSVTPRVVRRVLYIFIYSCLISLVNYLYPAFYLSIGPFEYAGFILALILVFRINCGYDRWWEARKLWGSIVNSCRNLATIIVGYVNDKEISSIQKINNYIVTIPYLIKNQLRHQRETDELIGLLGTDVFNIVASAKNRPLALSTLLAQELSLLKNNNKLDAMAFLKAEEQREIIIDCLGACERIQKTPMPYVMAIKSRRFILIFLLALPCALTDISISLSPFITSLVAYAVFSIDQIGVELQRPFSVASLSHLPLDTICEKIKNDIQELTATKLETRQIEALAD